MKQILFIALFAFSCSKLFSQNLTPPSTFDVDCSTDFWTIGQYGNIQQWSLSGGTITGGDTILTGGGASLSYCGPINSPTFYTNNWAQLGIDHYDHGSGWINTSTGYAVQDNGGHLNDQYFTIAGAVIQYLSYWDGNNLTVIDSLPGKFFAGIFDIAVDTSGHAWIFTGSSPGIVIDSLMVYDQDGQINSYSFPYEIHGDGSFFLNDTLYIGTLLDSIFPVIISGNQAILGAGIPFSNDNYFTDMASCQYTKFTNSVIDNPSRDIKLFPNPTDRYLTLPNDLDFSDILVCNALGQVMEVALDGNLLDLKGLEPGLYYLRMLNKGRSMQQTIMKY